MTPVRNKLTPAILEAGFAWMINGVLLEIA